MKQSEFTKKERHVIYQKALEIYKEQCMGCVGLCYAITKSYGGHLDKENPHFAYKSYMIYRYPEIWQQRPDKRMKSNDKFWWPEAHTAPRIQVLENAIMMTK